MRAFHPQSLVLVDRDLQALSISQENLVANGYERDEIQTHHQVGIVVEPNSQDLVIGILSEQQNMDVYLMYLAQAEDILRSGGLFVLATSSTVITKIEEVVSRKPNWSIRLREKNKGRSVMVTKKK